MPRSLIAIPAAAFAVIVFQACAIFDSSSTRPEDGIDAEINESPKLGMSDTSASEDTVTATVVDTVTAGVVDTLKATVVDSVTAAVVDTVKAAVVDTVKTAVVDTATAGAVDTVKAEAVDTVNATVMDTVKAAAVNAVVAAPLDIVKTLPGSLMLRSDIEEETAGCWGSRDAKGYSRAPCGIWNQIGTLSAKLSEGRAHSGSKALSVTFAKNEEVAGASLPVSADLVSVRAYYLFDSSFDFGQGVKVGRISSFNETTQLNDIDIILAVRSSGSVNQCGLTDMADLSLLFNGKPAGYDWGLISGAVRFERNRWYAVEYQVKLNRPGANDGSVKLWVDGQLVASKQDMNIRGRGGENVKLNRLRMGGWYSNGANGNACRNPSQPSTMLIDDVAVGSDYIGL